MAGLGRTISTTGAAMQAVCMMCSLLRRLPATPTESCQEPYHSCRDWADSVDARAQTTQYRLETELSGYKTNLIKESIRMGHHELADFFYDRGDLQVPVHQRLGVLSCLKCGT